MDNPHFQSLLYWCTGIFFLFMTCSSNKNHGQTFPEQISSGQTKNTGIQGSVKGKSDVAGEEIYPLQALLFVVPEEKLEAFLESVDIPERDPLILHRLWKSIPEDTFQKYVAAHTHTDEDGQFHLPVAPGTWWLCLGALNSDSLHFPFIINGSIKIEVQDSKMTRQDLFWGEAGMTSE